MSAMTRQLIIDIESKVKLDWWSGAESYEQVYSVFVAIHALEKIRDSFGYLPITILHVLDPISADILKVIESLKSKFTVNIGRYVLIDTSNGRNAYEIQKTACSEKCTYWYTDRPASRPRDLDTAVCFLIDIRGTGDILRPKHGLYHKDLEFLMNRTRNVSSTSDA